MRLPSLFGMVHLSPLPGAPRFRSDTGMNAVMGRALEDASRLAEAGFPALMIENYGDAPFFAAGVPPVTVAALTSVVARVKDETGLEVGVNVPEATVMIIEQAERFGLAQLHQLRGRVGRSHHASHCVLLYGERLSDVAKERLKIIRDEQDGFVLAEEDLRLRGSGDLLGTKQTGLPEFIFADIGYDQQLLRLARNEAEQLLKDDPQLQTAQGRAVIEALQLFGYGEQFARSHAA